MPLTNKSFFFFLPSSFFFFFCSFVVMPSAPIYVRLFCEQIDAINSSVSIGVRLHLYAFCWLSSSRMVSRFSWYTCICVYNITPSCWCMPWPCLVCMSVPQCLSSVPSHGLPFMGWNCRSDISIVFPCSHTKL